MKLFRLIGLVVFATLLATFMAVASAQGARGFPDVSVQSKGEKVANMHTMFYDWYYTGGGREHHIVKHGGPHTKFDWPTGKVDTGAKVWVKSMRPDKPLTLELDSYTEVYKQTARPKGKVTVLHRSRFYPVRSADGKIKGWKTYFYTEEAPTDYYIVAVIGYEQPYGTHHSHGWVNDTVHLKTTR